ncbi:general secretion pathway protein GspJ [Pseudoxanthomonas kalamensis DSM 18571]|uniref:prepilin-type N-terminal cleavage/methylation domain-containing protein n=1 Tax=Pseudoxanthomonas kalamensis TaxID=289483 RepID=UPI00139121F3|nr:prepilin-type N-terminal cleavage/methylation domain-containing protein [Pseudoxanthomonas kalamensis]KAF1708872.1 general secretion pathway protein GspJ [Pseudoxanthomonas kalamensis DSM 18571]
MTMRARGFTLIEVLLATALLAAGLALAFATLRSATQLVERGERIAAGNERMRAAQGFLRARLAAAQPITFHTDPATRLAWRFVGEPRRMRFVSDLPDYLGRGGPYLHDLSADDDGRLLASFAMVQSGEQVQEASPRAPEPLAEGLRQVRFQYRGLDRNGQLGEWEDQWRAGELLPVQVRIDVETADGKRWPPQVITLALGDGSQAGLDGTGASP